ncbi:MAG: replication-associated recombination protein A [Patescibacteria group bacterium]
MSQPLASLLRPTKLDDFIGQRHLVAENCPLRLVIQSGHIPSMIFWGPPASGKTTLAEIIANSTESDFLKLSAVMDGKEELKKVLNQAKQNKAYGRTTLLFVDEIHRWNKAQQDALLPFVESGDITLIGATTENPSFEIISPLLSRSRVFVFEPHSEENLLEALNRGLFYLKEANINNSGATTNKASNLPSEQSVTKKSERTIKLNDAATNESGSANVINPDQQDEHVQDALKLLAQLANGDMRFALNSLELAFQLGQGVLSTGIVEKAIQKFLRHDKAGEEHYNLISAVHKSLRSSNPTAATYWIMRMLQAGDDPLYIARRLLRFASEDIGNASPTALFLANSVFDTCHKLGMPECETALIQLAEYLARAPKNNSAYLAVNQAKQDITKYGNLPVPMHFRNAPTKLMKEIGYGKGYEYDHDLEGKKSDQECLPPELKDRNYFNN